MSRALNIDADTATVIAMAAKHAAAISAIEPLHPRGTRVVLMNIDGANVLAKAFGKRVLTGPVTRTRLRP
ncbi:hypothetical protein E5A73_03475 [Sphingomonas gei]|uniref:Uncharacterized protein n=1 Tax=Sphingomonas gei TaxID=1395960 RepID=A0A4S1XHN0_9SPHN|nr:hypothetical protein [Sphingomonas gei]TGX56169.1 hypothetical protein E5A73_03475 [Sphingomonas gei]